MQIYFRMHHFVVIFQNFLLLRRQGVIDPPNQNPADALVITTVVARTLQASVRPHVDLLLECVRRMAGWCPDRQTRSALITTAATAAV